MIHPALIGGEGEWGGESKAAQKQGDIGYNNSDTPSIVSI